jgi:ornithine cyclodeaminase/alanine dehydrogenase-like protein (mu-crystallin family)
VQARTQLHAALEVRAIEEVFLYDPVEATREQLERELQGYPSPPKVTVIKEPDEGVAQSDIVITATTSATPTFSGSALREGTHVNAIGAYQPDRREVDEAAMRRAYVVVDGHDAAGVEAGELRIPGIKADADLSEVVTGRRPARTDDRQITLFKSVGMAVQDAMSAGYVFEQAEQKGIGLMVDFAGEQG